MKQRNHIRLAYLAGVLDSDGCIAIHRIGVHTKGRLTPSYSLTIVVNQVDGRCVDYLRGCFGGRVYFVPLLKCRTLGTKPQWRWEIRQEAAADLCKKVIPFLRIKKRQAEIGVRFWQTFAAYRKRHGNGRRGIPLSEHEVALREELYLSIRAEKQNDVPSAAVETKRGDSSEMDGKR